MGFRADFSEVTVPSSGISNRVYLTPELAIKIRNRKTPNDNSFQFLANKTVFDRFYPSLPVANVLAYDHFEKTDYEVLVMERVRGKNLMDDFIEMDSALQGELFGQILDMSNQISTLTFDHWGDIRYGDKHKTFLDFLSNKISWYSQNILEQELCPMKDIILIKDYFMDKIEIFKNEKISHFIHTDINNSNVLYDKNKISLMFDFDAAVKGPRVMMLPKIISSIDNMSGLEAGTPYYKMYRNKKFEHLYSILIDKFIDVFDDRDLIRKLNLMYISRELQLVAKKRYGRWNNVVIQNLIDCEIASDNKHLGRTYYGQILTRRNL